uniref:Peptidase A2 domain-containing protein n=1 Tax=Panagrolaimus superbus TaxID=310955 RepID=A0A914YRL7_9BILA
MCNVAFSVQLDSGSDISIITRDDYQKLGAPTLSPPQIKVKAVGNMKLELDGYFVADVTARGTTKSLEIYVADVASALLGLDFWHSFDLQIADVLLCQNVSDVPIEAAAPFVKQCSSIVSSPPAEVTQPQSKYDSKAGQCFSSPTENIPPESAAAPPLASNGSAKVIAAVSQRPIDNTQKELAPLIVPALGQFADAKDGMDECLSTRRINTIVTAPVTAHEINAALAEDVTATLRDKGKCIYECG